MTSTDLVKIVMEDKIEKNSSLNNQLRAKILKEVMEQQASKNSRDFSARV